MGRPPLPLQPRVLYPEADPKETMPDRWFASSGFESVSGPDTKRVPPGERDAVLARAETITREAVEAEARGGDGATAKAAGLQILAAELRREAGEWGACAENYAALSRYYLDHGEPEAADAYVQKLVFVSNDVDDEGLRDTFLTSAKSILIGLGKDDVAAAVASTASRHPGRYDAGCIETLAGATAENVGVVRGEEGEGNTRWDGRVLAGAADSSALSEFRFRAVPLNTSTAQLGGSPWWSKAQRGVEMLIGQPDVDGKSRYWVSHRVSGGIHDAVTLPNWSGRAMQAARTMVALSWADKEGTDGPSSAVLQVCCALEAFINAAIHFIRVSDKYYLDRIEDGPFKIKNLPGFCNPEHKLDRYKTPTLEKWKDLPKALFGPGWIDDDTWHQMTLLFKLRDYLMHYKGDQEESIFLAGNDHPMIGPYSKYAKPREAPRPWIDRVLTRDLATWTVKLGDEMIQAFRTAWAAERTKFDALRQEQDDLEDIRVAEADLVHELKELEAARIVSRSAGPAQEPPPRHGVQAAGTSGLRRIAAKSPNDPYDDTAVGEGC